MNPRRLLYWLGLGFTVLLFLGYWLAFHVAGAAAQTPPIVNLNTASLSWSAGAIDAAHPAAVSFRVKCGPASGNYSFPVYSHTDLGTLSDTLKAVLPSGVSGTTFCVVTAVNQYGESGPSNEVSFQVGQAPNAPTALTIRP